MYKKIVDHIRSIYNTKETIPLHEPCFIGNEKKYLNECVNSSYVSSIGKFVDMFEIKIAEFTKSKYAIACINGTSALHAALKIIDSSTNIEIITQPLTFIATANAITYTQAKPIFIDIDLDTLSISPEKLYSFLKEKTFIGKDGFCYNKLTKKKIIACIPVHTFGHPAKIIEIKEICDEFNISLIEDAAESLGSKYKNKHTGTFGLCGILSFNGNKIITTGGGGMIITNNKEFAQKAKHITTTAKIPHKWEYNHDQIGFNYRLPNINAALGVAQIEKIEKIIANKRELASLYNDFFSTLGIKFIIEPLNSYSNYWLNTIILNNKKERDALLKFTNNNNILTRPP